MLLPFNFFKHAALILCLYGVTTASAVHEGACHLTELWLWDHADCHCCFSISMLYSLFFCDCYYALCACLGLQTLSWSRSRCGFKFCEEGGITRSCLHMRDWSGLLCCGYCSWNILLSGLVVAAKVIGWEGAGGHRPCKCQWRRGRGFGDKIAGSPWQLSPK